MNRLLLVLAVACFGSGALLHSFELTPVIPWAFALLFVAICIPAALCSLYVGLLTRRSKNQVFLAAGWSIFFMTGAIYAYHFPIWLPAAILLSFGFRHLWTRERIKAGTLGFITVTVEYVAVWNLNYFAALLSEGRLRDPVLMKLDLWVYRIPDHIGMFPLLQDSFGFTILESAYDVLFTEIAMAMMVCTFLGGYDAMAKFIRLLFTGYATGIAVFLLDPAVGPPIHFPESLAPAYEGSRTHLIMQSMAQES